MKKFWYIPFSITLFFLSCHKKDFPETVPATHSDFYFNGTIEGKDVSLKAGIDNYYMYSSYTLDSTMIYNFIADLKQSGCTNCKNSLQVRINDFKYSVPNEGTKIDSSLLSKAYPILGAPFYAVQFRSLFNQQAATYLWNFGDNSSSRQADPIHVYSATGNYSVSLQINSTNGCQQYISNNEHIRYPASNVNIIVVSNSANYMTFKALVPNAIPPNYQWDFGDGYSSNGSITSHTYTIPGTYPVSLRVINDQQDTLYARYNVATQTNPMPCLSNYAVESVSQVVNPAPFSNIVINWTDENGDVYTSNNILQPTASFFKIISVEDYDPNERGEKVKKIRVNFKCQVYSGIRMKVIDNAEAIVCVSYK